MRSRLLPTGGLLLLLCLVGASPGFAQKAPRSLQRAFEAIEDYVAQRMEARGAAGLSLALTTGDSLLYLGVFGYADLKRRTPVTETTLFQIGSITKSFTALALMQRYDEGRFDPEQPVASSLLWFDVRSAYEAITPHHLLTHSAGIPANRDDMPGSPYQAYALRQQATAWPPGSRFHYSNVGYQVLHVLLETLAEKPYAKIIEEHFFEPLGMKHSRPVITLESRSAQAVGYIPPYDDRPHHRSRPLAEAPHFGYGIGDGSIQSTATDMAAYVRMLLKGGRGPQGRLVSEKAFERFATRHVLFSEDRPNAGYGYGIGIYEHEGRRSLSHSGGMVGFGAYIEADLTNDLGVVIMANGPGVPGLAAYALAVTRAALHGETLPPPPPIRDRSVVRNARAYAGAYQSATGETIHFISPDDSTLALKTGSITIRLEGMNDDVFYTPHPDFDRYPFAFVRDSSGSAVEVFHGPTWYTGSRYQGPTSFETPLSWSAFGGRYRSYSPWLPYAEVFVRKGRFFLVTGEGGESASGETELFETAPGEFRIGEGPTPEIIRFEDIVGGQALRLVWTGHPLFRSDH